VRCARSPPGVLHRASCTGRPAPGDPRRASCAGCSAAGVPRRVFRSGCPTSGCATPRAHPPWSRACVRPPGVPTQCPGAGAFARSWSRANNVDQTAAVLPIGDPVRWCRGRHWLRPLTPPLRAVDAPRNSLAHTLPSGSSPRGFRRSRIVRSWFIRAPRARRCIGRGREVKEHSATVVHRGVPLFHVKQPRRRRSTTRSNLASRFLSGSHEGHGALASRPPGGIAHIPPTHRGLESQVNADPRLRSRGITRQNGRSTTRIARTPPRGSCAPIASDLSGGLARWTRLCEVD
jgi:hypothetical protein